MKALILLKKLILNDKLVKEAFKPTREHLMSLGLDNIDTQRKEKVIEFCTFVITEYSLENSVRPYYFSKNEQFQK